MKVKVKISEVIKYLYPAMLPLTKELKVGESLEPVINQILNEWGIE